MFFIFGSSTSTVDLKLSFRTGFSNFLLPFKCRKEEAISEVHFGEYSYKGKHHLGVEDNSDFHTSGLLQAVKNCMCWNGIARKHSFGDGTGI